MYNFNLFVPTPHLLEKLKARNVTWAEVVDILEHPEVVYGPDRQGRKVVQKGDLSVVLAPNNAVITVLLRDAENWDDEAARERETHARRLEQTCVCGHMRKNHYMYEGYCSTIIGQDPCACANFQRKY